MLQGKTRKKHRVQGGKKGVVKKSESVIVSSYVREGQMQSNRWPSTKSESLMVLFCIENKCHPNQCPSTFFLPFISLFVHSTKK